MASESCTSCTTISGNTSKNPRSRNWVFTLNNYENDDIEKVAQNFHNFSYVFQEETGKAGTPHLQGCVKFDSGKSFKTVKKMLGDKAHLEICRDWKDSVKYCSKTETRTGRVYTNMRIEGVKDPLETLQRNKMQEAIIEIHNSDREDRKIIWFYDEVGNCGKTTIAKHLCIKYPREVLYLSGKSGDCKYAVTTFLDDEKNNLKTVLFDYTRSQEDYISYEVLESIKNGIFFNNKYESKMIVFDNPHVIVLANFIPKLEALSRDRWIVYNVSGSGSVLELRELDNEF